MNGLDWIDAAVACAALGVRRQSLYAYVSRGLVRAQADAGDGRRSLYARVDVEALARRSRRPRARAEIAAQAIRWGDPVLATAVSEVRDGALRFRGRLAETCAETMSLEETAALLWGVDAVAQDCGAAPAPGATPLGRAMARLAAAAEDAAPTERRDAADIAREGGRLMAGVASALLGGRGAEGRDGVGPGEGPAHLRLAAHWGLDARGADDLRRALVLLADHDLNPSTFAVRVCASTGAGLPAALLCGLAALSGPRHGGAGRSARAALLADIGGRLDGFLDADPGRSPYAFGFGHPLYPEGDPRARHLLARLPQAAPAVRAVRRVARRLGAPPNIDAALAALSLSRGLGEDAPFILFATARSAGWIAHAAEQAATGEIIRPRGRYAPSAGGA